MKKKISPLQKSLNLWAVILIIWSFYRAKFRFPEWIDEFIAKPLVFVLPVIYYILRYERKKISEGLWIYKKKFFGDLILGILIGLVFFGIVFFSNFLRQDNFSFRFSDFLNKNVPLMILMALATGFSEELLSRGFVLKRLYEDSKNILTSSFFASILFFFLHVPILFTNFKLTGDLLLFFMVTDIILSLFNSVVFITRRSLFLPIFTHAFYNLSIILLV